MEKFTSNELVVQNCIRYMLERGKLYFRKHFIEHAL